MRFDVRTTGLLLIAGAVVTAGVYVALNAQRDDRTAGSAAASRAAPAHPSLPSSHPELPPSHPPVAQAPAGPGPGAREGTVEVDTKRPFTHYRVGNNTVKVIFADGNVMWLGTSGGMVRYDKQSHDFKTYDTTSALRSNGILHVRKLRGRIAVGTYGGGLSLLDQQARKWEHYSVPEGLGDPFVYDVLEDANGDVWIATGSGVNRVRAGSLQERANWQLYTMESTSGGLPGDKTYSLAQGKDGSIWFATEGGVARFRDGKWASWTRATGSSAAHPAGGAEGGMGRGRAQPVTASPEAKVAPLGAIAFDQVTVLEVDKDGKVWAGTQGAGLACFDGTAWKNYTMTDGLPSHHVAALHFDGTGKLWIGTDKGLAVLQDGKFRVMTTAHGLLAESVHSVKTTADGGIWVGSFGGVAYIRAPMSN